MSMQIRSQRAKELADALAVQRKVSVTEIVVEALEGEWKREAQKRALAERLNEVAVELAGRGQRGGDAMTKSEVDETWGH
jgi:antitoxin VapB